MSKYCVTFNLYQVETWDVIDARTFFVKAADVDVAGNAAFDKFFKAGCSRWDGSRLEITIRRI